MIYLLALFAGGAIAIQASMNAHLGALLNNALLATFVAFGSGLMFIAFGILLFANQLPSVNTIKSVPLYLWFSGGLLSSIALTIFYWLIPKIGIGPIMSLALSGQLLLTVLVGHFGWFQLPSTPLSISKLTGIACLIIGVFLINRSA